MKKASLLRPNNLIMIISSIIIVITVLFGIFFTNVVSALTYQDSVDIGFTFNPTVSISLSDNLSIDNLSPGNYGDSNEITVVSGTNSLGGYTLYATVGDNTHSNPSYNNTNLNHPNGTNTFTSISTNKASLSNFDENSNTWGYSYCIATNDCTNNTYWISGDYDSNNGNPSTGYNGLPLYTTVNGVKLVDTASNVGTSTIKFKIGARATNTQIAGTYTNVINFTAITKILTTNYTITYNDTTAEATGMPISQSDTITVDTNVTLSSTEPTRDGYNFAGWCTVDNSSDPTTCTGTTYQAGSTYAISNTGGNVTVPLYAVWEQSALTTYLVYYQESGVTINHTSGFGLYSPGDSVTLSIFGTSISQPNIIFIMNDAQIQTIQLSGVSCNFSFSHDFIMPNNDVLVEIQASGPPVMQCVD